MALQQANRKFERRFRQVEVAINALGLMLTQASPAQMEQVWQQVKRRENRREC